MIRDYKNLQETRSSNTEQPRERKYEHFFSFKRSSDSFNPVTVKAEIALYQNSSGCWHAKVDFNIPFTDEGYVLRSTYHPVSHEKKAPCSIDVVLNGNGKSKANRKIRREIASACEDVQIVPGQYKSMKRDTKARTGRRRYY